MPRNSKLEEMHRASNFVMTASFLMLIQVGLLLLLSPFVDLAVSVDWNWADFKQEAGRLLALWGYAPSDNIPLFFKKWLSPYFDNPSLGFPTGAHFFIICCLATVVGFLSVLTSNPYKFVRTHHGGARFATAADLKMWSRDRDLDLGFLYIQAWLFPMALFLFVSFPKRFNQNVIDKTGLVLGKFGKWFLRTSKSLSALILAPPGAGKTAGVAIPTLLSEGMSDISIFVYDIKGELFEKTGGYRAQYGPVFRFDPRGGIGARWNPLSLEKSLPKGTEMKEARAKVIALLETIYGNEAAEDDSFAITGGKGAWTTLHKMVTETDWEAKKREIYSDPEILIEEFERFSGLLTTPEKARKILRTEIFPLMEVINSAHSEQENYLSRMVNAIIPEQPGVGGNSDHFNKTGRSALLGMLGYTIWRCLEEGTEPNMSKFIDLWTGAAMDADTSNAQSEDDDTIARFLDEWITECVVRGYPKRYLQELVTLRAKPNKERASVVSTADSNIAIFKADTVRKQTATSDFSLDDFRGIAGPDGVTRPVTFYLVVTMEDLKSMAPIMTMLTEALIARLISQDAAYAAKARPVTFLLDEFAQIHKIDMLLRLPAVGRGQNVSVMLIAQSEGQIEETYGATGLKQLIDTTEFKLLFPLTDVNTAKKWSEAIGNHTLREETGGMSGGGSFGQMIAGQPNHGPNLNSNWSYRGAPLVSPSELMTEEKDGAMEEEHHILLVRRRYQRPIKCKTPYYFKDDTMSASSELPAPDREKARGYCGELAEELNIAKTDEVALADFDTSLETEDKAA